MGGCCCCSCYYGCWKRKKTEMKRSGAGCSFGKGLSGGRVGGGLKG